MESRESNADKVSPQSDLVIGSTGESGISLTPEEQVVLKRAIERIEQQVYRDLVKKGRRDLKYTLFIVVGIGLLELTNIKSSISQAVADRLVADAALKDSVKKEAVERIEGASELLKRSKELKMMIDDESARANSTLSRDLKDIVAMLEQIKGDLQRVRSVRRTSTTDTLIPRNGDADK